MHFDESVPGRISEILRAEAEHLPSYSAESTYRKARPAC